MVAASAVVVCACFAIQVLSNYLAQKKFFGGKDNKELSDTHPTYVSPDGFTFAIWGLIYTFELILVVAQLGKWSPDSKVAGDIFDRQCPLTGLDVRQRLSLAFMVNAAWLPVFNNSRFFTAFVVMAVYLAFLLSITRDLNEATVPLSLSRLVFGTGIAMNASWILVATFLSIFFCAGELGWKDEHGVAGSVAAAFITLALVACIGCLRAIFEYEMAWAFVAAWALRGVYRMQTVEDAVRFPPTAMSPALASFAMWASYAVVAAMIVGVVKASIEGPGLSLNLEGSSVRLLSDHN